MLSGAWKESDRSFIRILSSFAMSLIRSFIRSFASRERVVRDIRCLVMLESRR